MNKDIFLSNSLGNKKEKFNPINPKNIGMYVCGPTVYDDPHIGNARPLIIFDILFKVLKCKYGNKSVTYVRNITDIDDKIIKSYEEKKISITELTSNIIKKFQEDCEYLNCETPTHEPKATENIELMISMINDLIKGEFAYESEQHVYFRVKKFKNYGMLSNKNVDDLIAGARVELSDNKQNPEDFVLWKPSIDTEPSWDSPWGKGRPGWHLECSVMSKKYLGNTFDIHGGGRDLIFPHHENEIAQSLCANKTKKFANYWVHNNFITMSKEKMSKSQGNILKISDLKRKYNGQVLRLALISAHYSQPLDWNEKLMDECERTLNKWYDCYVPVHKKILIQDNDLKPLYDDLNTPGFIAVLHRLFDKAKDGNKKDKELFTTACNFIGLLNQSKEEWNTLKKKNLKLSEKDILSKINQRNEARQIKNYELADKIRNELLDKGILIEDDDGKKTWKISWQDIIRIGKYISTESYCFEKYVSVTGSACIEPKLLKTVSGASLTELTAGNTNKESRLISGSALYGTSGDSYTNYLTRYSDQVTIISDERKANLFNWLKLGEKDHSATNVFLSSITKPEKFDFDTNVNGGYRAIVPIGVFDEVNIFDIDPTLFLKSLAIVDLVALRELGIFDLIPEDMSVFSYVCPSKYDYVALFKDCIDDIWKEENS